MKLREIGRLFKDAGVKFWDDNGPRLGAALAFYTVLSISPLLLTLVAIVGAGFGQEAARGEIVGQIRDVVGQEGAVVIEQMIARSASPAHGIWAGVVALLILLIGASGVFSNLQSALNTIWKVPGRKMSGGFRTFLRERLLTLSLVGAVAFLLLVSLVISAILSAVNGRVAGWLSEWGDLIGVLNFTISFALTTVLFAMIFKWLPEVSLAWSDVAIGAIATAAMFSIGRYLIGLYLGTAAVGSAYGAAGAFVVLLTWVYYSTQILLYGAELTFTYATQYGHGIRGADVAAITSSGPLATVGN